jgi:hypothetical protein
MNSPVNSEGGGTADIGTGEIFMTIGLNDELLHATHDFKSHNTSIEHK